MKEKSRSKIFMKNAGLIIGGSLLYALGMNLFLTPLHLFSGGGVGLAQLITLFLEHFIDVGNFNLYGIVYMLINIPLLFLAYFQLGYKFFIKTLIGSGAISLFITLVPTLSVPIVEDYLTAVLIGGIAAGAGVGLILIAGGSGGGIDVVAMWAAKKFRNASVGKISLYFNVLLYAIMLFLFDAETVIYSLIYTVIFTLILDKTHYQNINVRVMIFTKKDGIDQAINVRTGRGVTKWDGCGAYTKESTQILVSCINKYEVNEMMDLVHSIDPQAFIIVDENVTVNGNFEKRL
ncbi:MAG: YitT family protein [Lachnospiraceae bacterium]|nr:YitT family protein [Lachnospiraceae bacterium]MBQ8633362.1 YitT family protein [Lachnospiraceae bacterium]